ncbi:hypothetical protein P872_19685 [Rhodonellum psychrophilum GCM71 = DSM 17998]|uniref:Glycosyltransferase 2-like domain-containing protein n=2 Tax=Rhodonellum TaxID=336827 RepID=U5BVQ7_9BACT|nr:MULTISPECIES: glycosyltransferase [Rhodonellum]ERM81644.1 hypothetical protein P872_19685 [Rhodonellum psychrophilum GCM71 = DSM 17998]SDZ39400.1 Glycosyltransferase involved in cell wall bisynthesis [Rhodonellum ikkaensis]
MKRITIIIPVYNEEGNIENIKSEIDRYILSSQCAVSVVFVNDGSLDGSLGLIKKICAQEGGYEYISLTKNSGLSAAIKVGIDYVQTEWVGYMDGDLQTSPLDFLKFEPFIDDFELVTGFRENRKDSGLKIISSSFANWFRDSLLSDGIRDSGCPLKIFKRGFAQKLPFYKGMHRFLPALTQIHGGRVKEIPVNHFPRTEGISKFNLRNRLFHPFLDSLLVFWMKKRRIEYQIKESSRNKILETHA